MKKVPILLAVVLAASSARAVLAPPRALDHVLPAHPSRLVVKFRSTVTACAHCLLAEGIPFKTVTGSDSLDRLNRTLGVRNAHPLFLQEHELDADRRTAYRHKIDGVLARFPARSGRIPSGATVPDLSNVYVLDLPPGTDVAAAAARYAADPDVVYAQPDYVVQATLTPNDSFFSSTGSWGQSYPDLWGLHTSHADLGWDTALGVGTVVAVIDTGVDPSHPDLAANMWSNPGEIPGNGIDDDGNGFIDDVAGWDFVQNDATPMDLFGHGTHVAGTAAGVGNNGVGVVGMAWGAKIMAVRGLDANGSGYVSELAQAIEYAAENGADVLNNSWGGFGISQVLVDAVNTATSLGAVVVAAAGNSSSDVDNFEPAGIAGVIAAGAIDPTGSIAYFSNHGDALSVAAPGVDVLSTRSSVSPVDQFGARVGSSYLRLSGTSMASPHTAGLSALVLSGLPGLTPDEVRWQLELNATQPGYPGYEGKPWNPYFGWGQIDASHVFDPVPVTTRFRTHQIDLHGFVAETRPSAAAADFAFTTRNAVPWTLSSPFWLVPDSSSGSASARVPITLDTTGLGVGGVSGSVDLSAPSAVDGGGSVPAALQVHRDERVGSEILLVPDVGFLVSGPRVVQSSLGTLVFWSEQRGLLSALIDGAGTVSSPFQLADYYPLAYSISVAGDGQNFLLAWIAWTQQDLGRRFANFYDVKVMRIGPTGEPLGPAVTIESRKLPDRRALYNVRVGFDGSAFTVLWGDLNYYNDRSKIYMLRVAQDGLPRGKKQRIYPARGGRFPQFIEPDIACVTNECLVAWHEADGETSPVGKYIDKIAGVRLAGDIVVDAPPIRILRDADELVRVATDGSGYLVLVQRINLCAGPVLCGEDVIAARVAGGTSLDPDGIRLNTNPAPINYAVPADVAFDGTNYVVTFLAATSPEGTPVLSFLARLGPTGTVVDTESPGLLLSSGGTAGPAAITDTGTSAITVWPDSRFDDLSDGFVDYRSLFAQRVLAHP